MQTVYEKYRPAHVILMEYYWYCDHRSMIEDEWKEEDNTYKTHCDKLYEEYEKAHAQEKHLAETSKSARVAKRLDEIQKGSKDFEEAIDSTALLKKIRKT
jgi:hypothetical protein